MRLKIAFRAYRWNGVLGDFFKVRVMLGPSHRYSSLPFSPTNDTPPTSSSSLSALAEGFVFGEMWERGIFITGAVELIVSVIGGF